MNKKGMTIVELIVSFALTIVIALFLTEIVLFLKNSYISNGIRTEIVNKQTLISDRIYSLLGTKRIVQASSCEGNCVELTFDDGTYSQIAFNNKKVVIGDYVTELPDSCIVGNVTAGTESFNNTNNFNSLFQIYVPITSSLIKNKSFDINLIYQYNNNEENWSYNVNRNNYYLSIPNTKIILINSNFNPLDNVSLVDKNNNVIDVSVQYESKPSFDISKEGEYKIDYYTFYEGKTYISSKTIYVMQGEYNYNYTYTGNSQTFTVPIDGWYKIELWGAQGGMATYTRAYNGGRGAYTSGEVYLNKGETLFLYIGGHGKSVSGTTSFTVTPNGNGYNGGLDVSYVASNSCGGGGGGATDIRYNGMSLNDRIMVAGGGGGGSSHSNTPNYSGIGGSGGNLVGVDGTPYSTTCYAYGTGGSQTSGGIMKACDVDGRTTTTTFASFGSGGGNLTVSTTTAIRSGGGGYYGGGGSWHAPAGGGSSFISGYAGVNAITSSSSLTPTNNTIHYSEKYFINGTMTAGVNEGNGKAKITYLSDTKPNRTNTKLNNVRYIKDCMNGSSANDDNHWVEMQAIKDGQNLAKGLVGKLYNSSNQLISEFDQNRSYTYVTDGQISNITGTQGFGAGITHNGQQCFVIDLGQSYDLDEIAVWHYWADGRTYNDNITSVSSDNTNWIEVINKIEAETSNGKRVSAYSN